METSKVLSECQKYCKAFTVAQKLASVASHLPMRSFQYGINCMEQIVNAWEQGNSVVVHTIDPTVNDVDFGSRTCDSNVTDGININADLDCSDEIINTDPIADDDVINTDPNAHDDVINTDPIADDDVINTDPNAHNDVINTDPIGDDDVISTDPNTDDDVINTDPNTDDDVFNIDPIADDDVINTDPIADDDVINTDPIADDNVINTDPIADDDVINTDPNADNYVINIDPIPDDDVINNDPIADDDVINNDPIADNDPIPDDDDVINNDPIADNDPIPDDDDVITNDPIADDDVIDTEPIADNNTIDNLNTHDRFNAHDHVKTNTVTVKAEPNLSPLHLPPKIKIRGRPKGAGLTVIGLPRKKNVSNGPVKFMMKPFKEKEKQILEWILPDNVVKQALDGKLIELEEIPTNASNLSTSLLDENVNCKMVGEYFTKSAWLKATHLIEQLQNDPNWICVVCQEDLSLSDSIVCECCLVWYHFSCAGLCNKPKRAAWFCIFCYKAYAESGPGNTKTCPVSKDITGNKVSIGT